MNNANNNRPRSNTTGDLPVFTNEENDSPAVVCPDWGCGFDEQIYSRSWGSSTGSTGSWTDDSADSNSDNIEDRHFAKALDQGIFDSVHEKNRKDRRKSFEKDHHSHHHHHHKSKKHHHHHHHLSSNDDNNNLHHGNRPRSKSIDVRVSDDNSMNMLGNSSNFNNNVKHGHNNNKRLSKRKLRQELCNSGINLSDTTDELSIDEIYEMQNRFFSSLRLTSDYIRQSSNDEGGYMDMPSSPVRKNRSMSFH